jgi:hypothetical protein
MIGKSGNRFPGKIVLLPGKSTPPDEAAGGKQDHADNGSGNAVFEADVVYRGVMPGHEAWQLVGGKYELATGRREVRNRQWDNDAQKRAARRRASHRQVRDLKS